MSFSSPLPVLPHPLARFRASVDCAGWLLLLDLLLLSTGLPGAAHATSFQLGWLDAAPCHLFPLLGSPPAAVNGRSWAFWARHFLGVDFGFKLFAFLPINPEHLRESILMVSVFPS